VVECLPSKIVLPKPKTQNQSTHCLVSGVGVSLDTHLCGAAGSEGVDALLHWALPKTPPKPLGQGVQAASGAEAGSHPSP
jgi:hypothetical protein